ncbi:hypothetical protein [Aquabacterium sp. NJ1]|uniref:hypothetical protein n=1 Tax=Aquabacterium sp. NJ1 TaxID=1538295 RepID=UPI00126A4F24|nr:hypothetical protein [Aquabacterium sp. NJ1]
MNITSSTPACLSMLLATSLTLTLSACGGGGGGAEVEARPQTLSVTASPSSTMAVNGSVTLAATASSGLPATYRSTTPETCSVEADTGVVTAKATGPCRIEVAQSGNETYAPATSQAIVFTVMPDPHQLIQFGTPPTLALGGTATVEATSTSGLPVRYSSLSPEVCSVNERSGELQALTTGDCIVAADQAGADGILPAPQATQTIPIEVPANLSVPGQAQAVTATAGDNLRTVIVKAGAVDSGGLPITRYTVASVPAGIQVDSSTLPATLTCPVTCAGYAFTVSARNSLGQGPASVAAHVITRYKVITTFKEPDTYPRNTLFTGSFMLDATTGTVSQLSGTLTESMTGSASGTAPYFDMAQVTLSHQLSVIKDDALGGVLVSTFRNSSTPTFWTGLGSDDWSPATGVAVGGLHYGYPSKATGIANPGNAYAMIFVNTSDPTAALTPAQLARIAYADCVPTAAGGMQNGGGMMGAVCMTGTSPAGYGAVGTMSGEPFSQVITKIAD